ncbi:NUDIX hydrolase [Methylovirgula sp. 4M-Z18]|uniref:NUDIX hydrolase n=1 Tax=Methylovirgula sp. 4M-Z18 TaxID=2293567 RepID=UPI000E2F8721|nr:NUDIX hydrolase [Methylovirgula sp. 4M-Z18]RFB75039.1 NUDIX hydrolase [Methylovirgula sp. 4M-Z18]
MSWRNATIAKVRAVECTFEPRDWPWAAQEATRIAAHWRARVAERPQLFDGRVFLQHRGALEGDVFRGAYLETRYSSFLAWRDFGFPDKSVRNCYAAAALMSSDGAFLLGEMNSHTATAGRIYFAAGTPDREDLVDGRVDLEGSVLRELGEETGLAADEVDLTAGWTLAIGPHDIACLKLARARVDAAALQMQIHAFLARDPQPELARTHVVRRLSDVEEARVPAMTYAYLRHVLGGK